MKTLFFVMLLGMGLVHPSEKKTDGLASVNGERNVREAQEDREECSCQECLEERNYLLQRKKEWKTEEEVKAKRDEALTKREVEEIMKMMQGQKQKSRREQSQERAQAYLNGPRTEAEAGDYLHEETSRGLRSMVPWERQRGEELISTANVIALSHANHE